MKLERTATIKLTEQELSFLIEFLEASTIDKEIEADNFIVYLLNQLKYS